ncbi:MAG: 16S rRNA (cytosine(1402)-N(4))-methyltransferase RsmH [Bdellovibrio sp.]|nr:16S rRNA (cytosine(1402)-N(4))-methyltransferase RsmH [Bdellovibrio sp.]
MTTNPSPEAPTSRHIPILVEPILEFLIEPFRNWQGEGPVWFVDATLGGGGHTRQILDALQKISPEGRCKVLAVDQDQTAVDRARKRFEPEIQAGRLELMQARFGEIAEWVRNHSVVALLADLGFSSDQMDDRSRGLSFQSEGPLDMRLDPNQGQSCLDLLESISEEELEKILREFGEERFSRRIASAIIHRRNDFDLPKTPKDLSRLVVHAIPSFARHGRIHAATRSFQALRMAVNEEVSQLDRLLSRVIIEVVPSGRIGILTFHSVEDRLVKIRFKDGDDFKALTKKPLQASDEEVSRNPRSRSAKLRVAERLP